jgi:hypothetical protein
LKALRGIVRLQALVRGRLVRKQLAVTLKCMHALLRVQERAREQRARSTVDGNGSQVALNGRATSTKDAEVYGTQHHVLVCFYFLGHAMLLFPGEEIAVLDPKWLLISCY